MVLGALLEGLWVFGPPTQVRAWLCHLPVPTPHCHATQEGQDQGAGTGALICMETQLGALLLGGGSLLSDAESGVKGAADQCCIPEMWDL